MIEGVLKEKLKVIEDSRGNVMHMLRCDSPYFKSFGEIYFSGINFGMIKAWRQHLNMTQFFAVPVGMVKLVIYDSREHSLTKAKFLEMELGPDNYYLVKIPPGLWYGFKGLYSGLSLIANCSDIPHDPDEIKRLEPSDKTIPYVW